MIRNKTCWIIVAIGIVYFLFFLIPNSMGIKNEHMLSLLSQDESIQYPYLMHMLTPGERFIETIKNFISYQHYFYGYPFYLISALVVLPVRLLMGNQTAPMTQVNILVLRQLVSVLPMIISAAMLTYLQTRFKSIWKSSALFIFLLLIPATISNNLWFWHPDALAVLGIVLTLYFLDRDNLTFSKYFYFSAIACGFAAAIKLIGFFFFLGIAVYLLMGIFNKNIVLKKAAVKALFFILILLAVFIALNPLLLMEQTRTQILKIQTEQNFYITRGWQKGEEYQTGLQAWLPYLRQWFGHPIFLLFLIGSLLYGCLRDKRQLLNRLILAWLIPYSMYLIIFVATKPTHYWLPTLLPLMASALILLPDDFFRKLLSDKNYSIKVYIPLILAVLLITFQLGININTDVKLVTRYLEKERLLLACNSNPENITDGLPANLDTSRWYRVEIYNENSSPPKKQFSVRRGPGSVTAYADHGESAWACTNQAEALFSATRQAQYFKESHPAYKVIGPDGNEVKP